MGLGHRHRGRRPVTAWQPSQGTIEQVKGNLYVIKGNTPVDRSVFSGGNVGVFVMGQGVAVVDTKLPGWGRPSVSCCKAWRRRPDLNRGWRFCSRAARGSGSCENKRETSDLSHMRNCSLYAQARRYPQQYGIKTEIAFRPPIRTSTTTCGKPNGIERHGDKRSARSSSTFRKLRLNRWYNHTA